MLTLVLLVTLAMAGLATVRDSRSVQLLPGWCEGQVSEHGWADDHPCGRQRRLLFGLLSARARGYCCCLTAVSLTAESVRLGYFWLLLLLVLFAFGRG